MLFYPFFSNYFFVLGSAGGPKSYINNKKIIIIIKTLQIKEFLCFWFLGQPKIRSGGLILVKTNRRQYKKLCNVFIKG